MNDGITYYIDNGLFGGTDWLSFTFPVSLSLDFVLKFFGFDSNDFIFDERGANGYRNKMKLYNDNIYILFNGNDNMGIHIDCSGSAVPTLVQYFKLRNSEPVPFDGEIGYQFHEFDMNVYIDMLSELRKYDVHFTRIDLFADDYGAKFYTLKQLHRIGQARLYVTRFKSWREQIEYETGEHVVTGDTIYLGQRSSDIMLRIYDKQLEQNKKMKSVGRPVSDVPWVRWELEIKHDLADNAVDEIIRNRDVGMVMVGVLENYFRIIDDDNERRSRCSTAKKWKSFISGIGRCQIAGSRGTTCIDQKIDFLMRQVSRTLATCTHALGGSTELVEKMLENGDWRMTIADEHMAMNYQKYGV